jgi:hypothetical protein
VILVKGLVGSVDDDQSGDVKTKKKE